MTIKQTPWTFVVEFSKANFFFLIGKPLQQIHVKGPILEKEGRYVGVL